MAHPSTASPSPAPLISPEEIEALAQRVTARDIERLTAADIARAVYLLQLEGFAMPPPNRASSSPTQTPTSPTFSLKGLFSRNSAKSDEGREDNAFGEAPQVTSDLPPRGSYSGGRADLQSDMISRDPTLSKKRLGELGESGETRALRSALLSKESLVQQTLASSQYATGGSSILDATMKVMLREHKMRLVTRGANDHVLKAALDAVSPRGIGMSYYWLVKEPHNQHAVLGYIPDSWKAQIENVAQRLLGAKSR